jgi:serine/threonine protein kinase
MLTMTTSSNAVVDIHHRAATTAVCLQSHLSTRRYGTVTHMPPELLVAGKLTPSADVYSFGIMSEFGERKADGYLVYIVHCTGCLLSTMAHDAP